MPYSGSINGEMYTERTGILSASGMGSKKGEDKKKEHGLSLWTAMVFIVGENAGCGLLALPSAMDGAGWSGIAVLIFCCVNAGYAGICLAKCWLILEERWEEYRVAVRYPYPAIGFRAYGKVSRYLVSGSIQFTMIGSGVVVLLLCADIMHALLQNYTSLTLCMWVLILAAVLWPIMWFGTPSDFWGVALGAMVSTSVACILILIKIGTEVEDRYAVVEYSTPTVKSFFLAFGTILFSFGGTCGFPTFQNDMKNKEKFPKAVVIGFIVLLLLYLPLSALAYAVFGKNVSDNILTSIGQGPLATSAQILLAGHLFFAFLILVNPPAQEFEEALRISPSFNWKRCVLRTFLMLIIVFVAQSIPHFGKILNLIGGSTITLLTFIFPPLFYMRLCSQKDPTWPERSVSIAEKVYLMVIIATGVIGGVASTVSALMAIADPAAFTPPCYINSNVTDV